MYSESDLTPEAMRADIDDLRERARLIDEVAALKEQLNIDHLAEISERIAVIEEIKEHPRLNEKLWFGWTRWAWMLFAYVFVAVIMAIALGLTISNENQLDFESQERERQRCEVTAESRDGVRRLVLAIIEPPEDFIVTPEYTERYNYIVKLTNEILPPVLCEEGVPQPLPPEGGG